MVSVDVDIVFFRGSLLAARYSRGSLTRETHAAPARAFRVRVVEEEAAAHQAGVVIERRTVDERVTLRIDEHLRALRPLEHVIAFARRRFPGEHVAEAGTPAGL